MPDFAAVRPGEELDLAALQEFLGPRLNASRFALAQFPGGHSNLTYLLTADEREFVLRRAPLGPLPPKAHDMAREFQVLSLLHPVFPPAPAPVLLCEDHQVMGATFYLMERRKGVIYRDPFDVTPHTRERAEAMVDMLAELHAVDLDAAGLRALGKAEGFLERQVRGWVGRWEQAALPESPNAAAVIEVLTRRIPPSPAPTVVHNDYKLDNVMFAPESERIVAVLDWEMTTIGDPLADVGLALCYWELGGAFASGRPAPAQWLTPGEFIARYAERTGRDLSHLAWHRTLGVFKLAVILQQIFVRYRRGQTRDERFAGFGPRVESLMARAGELAACSI
jgi:aminoglycoside phosphotransferase (APT) family kinase protein